ncbi:MAG: hypothetical protein H6606_04320 [Flavobacteriales bacterium]|nr:hypothetical protein [Flavobacteriales bacterium]
MRTSLKTILVMALIGSASQIHAQTEAPTIEVNSKFNLTVEDVKLKSGTKAEALLEVFGEPDRTKESSKGEITYLYDSLGFMFVSDNDVVRVLGINFNWDGDTKFPEKSFTGTLKLGEQVVVAESIPDNFAENKSIAFACPIPLMCASKDRSASLMITSAFKDGVLSQVLILIK